jgi:F-type H+-transporting ATPase subunit delta
MANSRGKTDGFDSGRQQVGAVYAKALLGAAEKAGQADLVVEELESLVADVFNRLPQVEMTLASPRLSHEERLPILDRAFSGRMSPTALQFLKVVSKHGRLDCLRAIARSARKQLNELRGRVEVLVETAQPLSNPLRERIVARLTQLLGREVIVTSRINEDLLGGVVVRVGDTVYDGSLAAQLKRVGQVTLEHTKQQIRESLERFAVST